MTLREQYEKETGFEAAMRYEEIEYGFHEEYVGWLEQRLLKAEEEKKQKAWEAWKRCIPLDCIEREEFEQWWNEQSSNPEQLEDTK